MAVDQKIKTPAKIHCKARAVKPPVEFERLNLLRTTSSREVLLEKSFGGWQGAGAAVTKLGFEAMAPGAVVQSGTTATIEGRTGIGVPLFTWTTGLSGSEVNPSDCCKKPLIASCTSDIPFLNQGYFIAEVS